MDTTASTTELSLLQDWAQDAVYDFLIETRVRLTSVTINLTAGQKDYSLATVGATLLGITDAQLTSGGTVYDLERVTMEELLDSRRASQTAPDRPRLYAAEGDLFAVYPTPASADTITAYGPIKPTAMSADANDITTTTYGGIPIQHHQALIAYMVWRGSRFERFNPPYNPDSYEQQYRRLLAQARRRIRSMGGRRNPGILVGYPGTGSSPGTRNDIYP